MECMYPQRSSDTCMNRLLYTCSGPHKYVNNGPEPLQETQTRFLLYIFVWSKLGSREKVDLARL